MPEDSVDTSLAAGGTENSQEAEQGNQTAPETTQGGITFDLPAEERAKLERFKSYNDLGKSYLELERKLGASITFPGKNATEEERTAFYKRLGRPDSPDGYELDSVITPNGVNLNDEGDKQFKEQSFKLGLSKEQAENLHKWWVNAMVEQTNKYKQQIKDRKREASEALRKEYGLDYDKKLALVGLVNQKFGGDDWIQYLNQGPGNDPQLLRMLIKIGEAISEDTLIQGRPAGTEVEREEGLLSYPNRPEITGNRFRSVR